jgi:hypothetical protein
MLARGKAGWVGFDVGATSVKAAQVVRADGECRIRAAAIVPRAQRWAPAAFRDDQPQSSLGEIRSATSLCERLTGSYAATVLPVAVCDLLQMDAPATPRSAMRSGGGGELLRSVEAECNRPMRDRVFDCWPVGTQPGRLNVVTAPRAWSDQVAGDVAGGGWQCRVIDALPWALARATTLVSALDPSRPVAALDWAYGKSTICFVHKGAPVFVRSLRDCGFQDVLQTVASGLRLDERDAELLLHKHGFRSAASRDGDGVVEDLLERPVARLTQEVRRTFDYWRGASRGQTPEAIYVFGGGGTLAGIGPALTERLGVAGEAWQMPLERPADASWMPPACLLGVAAGLSALAWEAV